MTRPHVVAHGRSLMPRTVPGGHPRPRWVDEIVLRAGELDPGWFSDFLPPPDARHSAVLVLFGPDPTGQESLLLTERAHTLRSHAGQIAFPGGAVDPEDHDIVSAALREGREEVLLDPAGVDIVGELPALYVPVSGFAVTPVVAWWRDPRPVGVGDPAEVEQVLTVPIDHLGNPANRFLVSYPTGRSGPAWELGDGLVLWGFTAGVVDKVLDLSGLAGPWDRTPVRPLPADFFRRLV